MQKKTILAWAATAMATVALLGACGEEKAVASDSSEDITSEFMLKWNASENLTQNNDGSITYDAVAWGGMSANFDHGDGPADWSDYEKIVFEFTAPTEVSTQVMVDGSMIGWSRPGLSKAEGMLAGRDMTHVNQVALQASDVTTITVKRVFLVKDTIDRQSTMLWEGSCAFGDWDEGFVIQPEKFATVKTGDVLEFVYTNDESNSFVSYWQLKTTINGTDDVLYGNATELNNWNCVNVGQGSTNYRIKLAAKDVTRLRENGLFVNGYFNIVTRVNLLQ